MQASRPVGGATRRRLAAQANQRVAWGQGDEMQVRDQPQEPMGSASSNHCQPMSLCWDPHSGTEHLPGLVGARVFTWWHTLTDTCCGGVGEAPQNYLEC